MKIIGFLLLSLILLSCKDDISNDRFRNENYVFYQEDGKAGEWLKIDPNKKIKPPKSFSTYFFPNGNRYAELKVLDSFPNRVIKFFDKEDRLTRTTKFEHDSAVNTIYEDGYYKEYSSSLGLLNSQGLFINNLSQGKWEFYRDDGKTLRQIVHYKDDIPDGIREDFWENGKLESRVNYINGKQTGEVLHYYESGELMEKSFVKDGKFHGLMKGYFKNGNISYTRNYWNDLRIDTCKTFYENGNIKNLQIIQLDTCLKRTAGKELRYFENGKIQMKSDIKNNLPDGILIKYYENGQIKNWQQVKANKIYGDFVSYYENGKKKKEGRALNNILKDTLFHYKQNGNPDRTYIMENGFIKDSIIY